MENKKLFDNQICLIGLSAQMYSEEREMCLSLVQFTRINETIHASNSSLQLHPHRLHTQKNLTLLSPRVCNSVNFNMVIGFR